MYLHCRTRQAQDQTTPMELEYINLMPSTSCDQNRQITKISPEDPVQVASTSSVDIIG